MKANIIVKSSTSYNSKDTFLAIASAICFKRFDCYYDINHMESRMIFTGTITGGLEISVQVSPLTAGYPGEGPHDLLECVRAVGFSEEILPKEWILNPPADGGKIVQFSVTKN